MIFTTPADATHRSQQNGKPYKFVGDTLMVWQALATNPGWHESLLSASSAQLQPLLHQPDPLPVWTGEGPPPVGTVCEFQGDCASCPSDPWHKDLHDGVECTVIAHFKSKDLLIVAFTFVRSDGHVELEQSLQGALKPIRTAEQIEADQRKAGIDAMGADIGLFFYDEKESAMLAKLYDANYRKQVAP